MSVAKKCDLCGKLYELYDMCSNKEKFNAIIPINIDGDGKYWSHGHIDFCPQCRDAIKSLMKERSSHV